MQDIRLAASARLAVPRTWKVLFHPKRRDPASPSRQRDAVWNVSFQEREPGQNPRLGSREWQAVGRWAHALSALGGQTFCETSETLLER
jgi:hypothetical protein